MKIDTAAVIRRYEEFIALLEDEKHDLLHLCNKPTNNLEEHLTQVKHRQRLWEIDAEITAKRQYIAAYKQRADQERQQIN